MIGQPATFPPEKRKEIARYLHEKFDSVVKARSQQVDDKMMRWDKNYDAVPYQTTRTTPFYRASNFVPNLIMMHCDITTARILGILFGTKPFWKPTHHPMLPMKHEQVEALQGWMNFKCTQEIDFFHSIDTIVSQMVRTGTQTAKVTWADDKYMVGGTKAVSKARCVIDPIPFDDFWPWPITAPDLSRTLIKFTRMRMTREQVEDRRVNWNKEATDLLVNGEPAVVEPSRDANARAAGISLTEDVDFPFTAIEAWFEYKVGDRKHCLVAEFNPQTSSELSLLSLSFAYSDDHPFVEFRPFPRKGLYYGYSIPERLEQAQEEQAQIHNQRRDSGTIANIPTFKKKRYADVPHSGSEWYPGKVFELDDVDDMDVLNIGASYNSMIDEEQYVTGLAERYTGISPPMQGFGAGQMEGKRGVYTTGGTLALLSEGNSRMDIYIRRVRASFHQVGALIFTNYRLMGKEDYTQYGPSGQYLKEAFNAQLPSGFVWGIGCSDAAANKEIDRTNLLMVANTLGSYYQQLWQGVSVVGQMPPDNPMREVLLSILDGAKDLADRILFAFDQGDRERLLPDVRKLLSAGGPQGGGPPAVSGDQAGMSGTDLSSLSERIAAFSGRGPEQDIGRNGQ